MTTVIFCLDGIYSLDCGIFSRFDEYHVEYVLPGTKFPARSRGFRVRVIQSGNLTKVSDEERIASIEDSRFVRGLSEVCQRSIKGLIGKASMIISTISKDVTP